MKRFAFFILLSSFYPQATFGQLTINNTYAPTYLINNILLPAGSSTVVSNVQLIGIMNQSSRYQIGAFQTASTTLTQMGFSSGLILTSGNTSEIPLTPGVDPKSTQVSRNYTSCTTGEVRKGGTCPYILNDLMVLAGTYNYYNTAMLEFDFVAAGDAVSFRYIFGSEEYEDDANFINYQCSNYSDRFAFLLSGPGISGGQGYTSDAKNIARLSNGSIVSINSVNNGSVGSLGGAPSASKCLAANPAWVNGTGSSDYLGTIDGTNMNGNTKILTAFQSGLIPGQTYHIRLIIMDLEDGAYDSVVYLESASFTSEATPLPVALEDFNGKCTDVGISLNWKTSNERSGSYFTIERYNLQTNNYEVLDYVNSISSTNEITNHALFDEAPLIGTNIYRISETDYNGVKTELSTIAVENSCQKENDFNAFFNSNGGMILTNLSDKNKSGNLSIFDASSKLVFKRELNLTSHETLELTAPINFSTGLYIINFETVSDVYNFKILKM